MADDVATTTTNFDDLLSVAGDCSRYQLTIFLLISLIQFVSIDAFAINFLAADMDHWCYVRQLSNLSVDQQRRVAVPPDDRTATGFSRCLRYDVVWDEVAMTTTTTLNDSTELLNDSQVTTCEEWTYEHSQFTASIVSQWDLVCERSWLVDLVSTIYMTGRLVACLVIAPVADRLGRKAAMLLFHAVKMSGCVLSIYSPNYDLFALSRFLIALGSTAATLATFLIVSEVSGIKWRSVFGVGWNAVIALGAATMPAIAHFIRDYRHLQAVYTWPQFSFFLYALVLDESPRWLVSRGQHEKATRILRKIARVNRRQLPSDLRLHSDNVRRSTCPVDTVNEKMKKSRRCNVAGLVATPNLRIKTLIICLNWFVDALMFYALSLNAGRLPGSVFFNVFLLSVVEIPANVAAAVLLERIGRRLTVGVSTLLGGLASLLMIPFMFLSGGDAAVTAFAILGKGLITVAYSSIYVVTTDTYPTSIRAAALGLGTSVARAGSMASSFVGGILTDTWRPLPSVIYGTFAVISGAVVFLLPETVNQRLPATVEEAENFGRRYGCCCSDASSSSDVEQRPVAEVIQLNDAGSCDLNISNCGSCRPSDSSRPVT